MKLLLLDNYDSFTYNLQHYLLNSGASVNVVLNDQIPDQLMDGAGFDAAVLSPGPGSPQQAGQLCAFISRMTGKKPLLGVCLGMQAIGLQYGWELTHAHLPVHGKPSLISHTGNNLFRGLPNPMQAGRYHSLILKEKTGTGLKTEAWCMDEIMAVSDPKQQVFGVQFHPESILTPQGQLLINNWIRIASQFAS